MYVCTYLANQCSLSPVGICMIRAISDNVITAVGPVKWILMFSVCLYVCARMWYNDSVGVTLIMKYAINHTCPGKTGKYCHQDTEQFKFDIQIYIHVSGYNEHLPTSGASE